jgi:4-hydroxybenzoyl-CoA reductase subunit beta
MMRPPSFNYHSPTTAREAAQLLADLGPDAMLLAGGTDLLPNMKRRQQVPKDVIGLRMVTELRQAWRDKREVILGAGLTLSAIAHQLTDLLGPEHHALRVAASKVATPHIQNMATLGGNLCLDTRCNYYNQNYEWRQAIDYCKKAPGPDGVAVAEVKPQGTCWVAPSSPRCWAVSSTDTAPVLCALGAEVTLEGPTEHRRVAVPRLYADDGMAFLNKRRTEVLTTVHVPIREGWRSVYWKLRRRGSFDFPVLGVAAAGKLGDDHTVEELSMFLGAVASYPVRVDVSALEGQVLTDELIAEFAAKAVKPAKPLDNTDYHLSWRKKVAPSFVAGALKELRGDNPEQLGLLGRTAARVLPMV